jgi:hypothetical protein
MKVLTVTGTGSDDVLQPFHIVNPTNLVINKGFVEKPGKLTDGQGNPIPIKEERTIIYVAGTPLFVKESVDEVIEQLEKL